MIQATYISDYPGSRVVVKSNPVDEAKLKALVQLPRNRFRRLPAPVAIEVNLASGLTFDLLQDGHHRFEASLSRKQNLGAWIISAEQYLTILVEHFNGITPDCTLDALRYVQCNDTNAFDMGCRTTTSAVMDTLSLI